MKTSTLFVTIGILFLSAANCMAERPLSKCIEEAKQRISGKADGTLPRVKIGVRLEESGGIGMLVEEVFDNSAALNAGIHTGDIVTELNGKKIEKIEDVFGEIEKMRPKTEYSIKVKRGEKVVSMTVVPQASSLPINLSGVPRPELTNDFLDLVTEDTLLQALKFAVADYDDFVLLNAEQKGMTPKLMDHKWHQIYRPIIMRIIETRTVPENVLIENMPQGIAISERSPQRVFCNDTTKLIPGIDLRLRIGKISEDALGFALPILKVQYGHFPRE